MITDYCTAFQTEEIGSPLCYADSVADIYLDGEIRSVCEKHRPSTQPLHPAERLQWLRVVEGGQVVCEHCGEPVPCIDEVLVHMRTDWHQMCKATGWCVVAKVPLDQLPQL